MSVVNDLSDVPLGAEKPDNPDKICVKCPDCPESTSKRWVNKKMRGLGAFKAMGFMSRCASCASRASRKRLASAIPDVPVPSGSIFRPSVKKVICGICRTEHDDYRRPKPNDKGFCEPCWPWARIALRPGHGAGPERDAIYAKIRDIHHALDGGTRRSLTGAQMPFCVLAKKWDARNPQANRKTSDTQSYNVRLLSFHFGTTPIGDITYDKGIEFRSFLLALPPTRGAERGSKRSEISVNQTLTALRRIVGYACEQGWLRKNPFPVGGGFTPSRRERKPTPLVTVDEETRLLAACTGKLEYLRAIIICLLDTGMRDADRQRLRWSDVDFEAGLIRGSGVPMRMTPRLREVMLALRDRSDHKTESLVWGGENITGLKKDLGRAREAARVQGAHIRHFRPTAAWRMIGAGREFLQVATVLGCTAEILEQYLRTDPAAAERERNSPSFNQFILKQFGGNGNGQKSGAAKSAGRKAEARRDILINAVSLITTKCDQHRSLERSDLRDSSNRKSLQSYTVLVTSGAILRHERVAPLK